MAKIFVLMLVDIVIELGNHLTLFCVIYFSIGDNAKNN